MDVDAFKMETSQISYIVIFNKIFLIIFVSIILFSCENSYLTDDELNSKEYEGKIILNEIEAHATEIGKPHQKVTAKRATFYELNQMLELEQVQVDFKPDDMSTGTLKADKGILYLSDIPDKQIKKNDVFLKGLVTYTNLDGIKLKSNDIYWNSQKGLYSNSNFFREVPIKDSIAYFEGKGFSVNSDFTEWKDFGAKVKIISVNKTKKGVK